MTTLAPGAAVGVTLPEQDSRAPHRRLSQVFDPGSFVPFPATVGSHVMSGRGTIDGGPVVAYCTDARRMGGALGRAGAAQIVVAIDEAVRGGHPVIGLWHSGGASLAEGVDALDGIGSMFAAMVRASGRVPQLSVVLGPAAGGAAYGPALTDIVIMAPAGRVFVTGPDVVQEVTGERIDMAELGGAGAHGRKSGVVHVLAQSEADAIRRARRIASLLTARGRFDMGVHDDGGDPRELLPERRRQAYDVRPLVRRILDLDPAGEAFEELQPRWAANIVVGFGRLRGHTVGVVANNPLRKGGCLDSLAAEKSARFVRMCDTFGIPLVVVVDVPGYLPGVRQEWDGVVRRGAKLLYAFAEATVPRVTLVTRKAFGGAYIAMNSRSLGASAVFAWPDAEIAVMNAPAAVGILHRRALAASAEGDRAALLARLVDEHTRTASGVDRGLAIEVVDAVIEPPDTRRRIADALAEALVAMPARRGHHGNIPL
jgi:acetyl-CoA/propionyl-CoA carboxylase carboxyl transferase subunit